MDSWTLRGDSYSFLRSSAPCVFSLRHRDGTPNHVEIFDITNIPSQRSAISETTCLCDIFGDDCESLSSSPATGAFVHPPVPPPRREAAVPGQSSELPPVLPCMVDELNDSTSSYHTAPERFEDSTEKLSPPTQRENNYNLSEGWESGALATALNNSSSPWTSKDISPRLEQGNTAPTPGWRTEDSSPEVPSLTFNTTTPSPGYSKTTTPSPGYSNTTTPSPGYCNTTTPSPGYSNTTTPSPGYSNTTTPSPGYSNTTTPSPGYSNTTTPSPGYSNTTTPSPGYSNTTTPSPGYSNTTTPSPGYSNTTTPSPGYSNTTTPSPGYSNTTTPSPGYKTEPPHLESEAQPPHLESEAQPPHLESEAQPPHLAIQICLYLRPEVRIITPELVDSVSTPDIEDTVNTSKLEDSVSTPKLVDYISTPELVDAISTPELVDYVSTPELVDSISTPELVDSFSTPELVDSISTPELVDSFSTPELVDSISTPELVDSISTPELVDSISTPELEDSISTPELEDSISTPELVDSISTPELEDSISTPELEDSISTPELEDSIITPELVDSISTPELVNSISTPELVDSISTPELEDSISTPELEDSIITPELVDSISTPELVNSISTPELVDSIITPELVNSISTPELEDSISTPELEDSISTPELEDSIITPELVDSIITPELVNSISTPELVNSISTPELEDSISTPELEDSIITPELVDSIITPELVDSISTPEFVDSISTPELISHLSPAERDLSSSEEAQSTISTPAPRYTPPTPVTSSPELRSTSTTPELKSASITLELRSTSVTPELSLLSVPTELRSSAQSPVIRITSSRPEIKRRDLTPEVPGQVKAKSLDPRFNSSSPQVSGITYSILSPEARVFVSTPEINGLLSSAEPRGRTHLSPERKSTTPTEENRWNSLSPDSIGRGSSPGSRGSNSSPEITGIYSSIVHLPKTREIAASPQPPRYKNLSPEYKTPSTPKSQTVSPYPTYKTPSPLPRYTAPSPGVEAARSSSELNTSADSPGVKSPGHSPERRASPGSPGVKSPGPSPERRASPGSPGVKSPGPSPERRALPGSPGVKSPGPSPERRALPGSPGVKSPGPSPERRASPGSPGVKSPGPSPERRASAGSPGVKSPGPSPERRALPGSPGVKSPGPSPERRASPGSPGVKSPGHSPERRALPGSPGLKSPCHSPERRASPGSPGVKSPGHSPERRALPGSPGVKSPGHSPERRASSGSPEVKSPGRSPELRASSGLPGVKSPGHSPERRALPGSPGVKSPGHSPELRASSGLPGVKSPGHSPERRALPGSPGVKSPGHSPELRASSGSPEVKSPGRSPERMASPGLPERRVGGLSERLITNGTSNPLGNHLSHDFRETSPTEESREITSSPVLGEIPVPYNFSAHSPEIINITPEIRNFTPEIRPISPDPTASSRGRGPSLSPDHGVTGNSPVQRLDDLEPKHPASSLTPDLSDSSNPSQKSPTPKHPCRETSPNPRNKTIDRLTEEDMAHRMGKENTPSPPLTRFTPVHIIPPVPGRPHGHWGKRNHRPPETQANKVIMESENMMESVTEDVTPRGSPTFSSVDSNTRTYDSQSHLERRQGEERVPGKGEGRQEQASYKGEQVDLSFSVRNRKGPASREAAPTSRESRQGMPAARSYSESLLTTRLQQIQQIQQQQHGILHRAAHSSQPETARGGGPGPTKKIQPQPKYKPAISQLGSSVPQCVSADGPSSSMGSKLDEEDNEVKWFSDVAFRSLSSGSPQLDYLDMYNSSHRSSTGASQPSIQDSPAGANAAWLAYADLRGSAPRLDNEDFPVPRQQQQPSSGAYYPPHDDLDPSKKYEMGSYECVDMAVEREEPKKVRRGVPKRQIQLKRRNTAELKMGENSNGSPVMVPSLVMVPVVPVASIVPMDSPSLQRHNRETLQRQHSTPPALQEAYCPEPSPEPATERTEQTKRNGKLQKSLSLDETCTKTKMATCLINNILSKKMQNVGKQTDQEGEGGDLSPSEANTSPPPESEASTLKESTKPETLNLSSNINSDDSFSSEHLAVRRETSPNTDVNRQQRSFGVKSSVRPMNHTINTNSTPLQRSNKRPEPTSTTPEMSPGARFAPVTFPRRSNERIESHSNRSPNHVSPWMRSEPPTTSCPQRNSDRTESPARNPNSWRTDPVKPEMRSELVFPFESKKPTEKNARMGGKQKHDSKWRDEWDDSKRRDERDDSKWRDERDDKQAGDSADAAARNTSVPAATRASSTQAGMTNTKLEYPSDSENHKHPSVKSTYMSKTPEITLKSSPVTEIKKTSSLNISLLPEMETKPEGNHETASPGRTCQRETTEEDRTVETSDTETRDEDRRIGTSHRETREEEKGVNTLNKMNEQTVNMDANRNSKVKAPMHKVRDVRRLVKNTYNLSFKAMPAPEKEERREERREEQRQERREERKEERKEERREEKKDDRVERKEGRCEEIIVRREERKEKKLPPHLISLQKEEKLPPHPISLQKEEQLPPHLISLQKEEKLPPHLISLQKEEKLPPHLISLQKEEKLPPHPISLQKEEKLPPHPISLQKEEKLPPHPISLQKEEKLPPHLISLQEEEKLMQIEFKAISWRENKNKTITTSNKTDRETSRCKPKPDSLQQVSKGPRDLTDVAPKSCATEEVAVTETESNQHKIPVQDTVKTETGNTKVKPSETESPRVTRRHRSISESSDKPEVLRRDTKPPMLGSSPKLPSKDRRVSCASLVLQDGSNKPKSFSALVPACSPAPAPAFPVTAPTLASSPSLGPKTSPAPASPPAPASSPVLGTPPSTVPIKTPTPSHSVSILVKEKGYQADIGSLVSEAVSEAITRSGREGGREGGVGGGGGGGGGGVPGKHINQIEIPLQTRGPSDGGTSDSHRQRTYSSSSTSYVKAASSVSSSSTVKETSSFSSTSVNASTSASSSVNASTSASSSVNASTSASSFSSSSVNASASSSHTLSAPNSPRLRRDSAQTDDSVRTPSNQERVSVRATVRDIEQRTTSSPPPSQKKTQEDTAEKETVKKSTYSPKLPGSLPGSPALMRTYQPQVIEVRSLSNEIHKQDKQEKNITSSTRPQTIEVHSIANSPPVALKPKFKPTDANSLSNETQQTPVEAATSTFKQHTEEERPVNNEKPSTSATTIHRHLSNDSTPPSNYNKKLSVSAVSSYRPSPNKTTIIANFSHKPVSTTADTETSNERPKQPEASTQGQGEAPSYTQRPTTLTVSAPAPASAPAPNQAPAAPAPAQVPTHAPAKGSTNAPAQVPTHAPAQVPTHSPAIHSSQPAVVDITNHLQHPKTTAAYPQEQTMPVTFNNTNQPATVSTNTQAPVYTHHIHTQQPIHRSLSSDHSQRADNLRFYASDDPPSYDERERFSPLHLPDLPQRKLNRDHPSSSFSSASSRPPPCSCTSGCPSHGLTPPHHHHSPHTPPFPFPSHSPGQPPLRLHQCRADPHSLRSIGYQPSSPKSSTLPSPTQPPPGMYQSLHQPHPSILQPCLADRPLQHPQHMEHRRAPTLHCSPQGQPSVSVGPYSDLSHSPNLPPMDPQYLCSSQSLGPSYGSDYGSLSGSDYPDSTGGLGYGQTPRRVLMDPDTGKYFYIEVPVQPLRKMLFDPETGQYVEVLIPQTTMSHSGLYPPLAAPYSSIHNPNIYSPAPQYLPYGPPPPAPHPQSQPQPPRHPEAPAPGTMHQNGAQVGYGSKPEPQNHAPLDQSYLDSMYYVPTGMNTSPPDCYHKQPSSLPNAGGKRA
ncbi:uncharacterized protein ACWYII_046865 [Salvelinus alpinus]